MSPSLTTAPMPVVASPIAMLMFPPMELHTTVPWTAWSFPSIVTVVLPSAEAAEDVSPEVSDFFRPMNSRTDRR